MEKDNKIISLDAYRNAEAEPDEMDEIFEEIVRTKRNEIGYKELIEEYENLNSKAMNLLEKAKENGGEEANEGVWLAMEAGRIQSKIFNKYEDEE